MKLPSKITPELAEEIGWHIGDGSMNIYKKGDKLNGLYQLRGHIEDDKEHYLKRIKPIFKKLFDIDVHIRDMPSTRVVGFQIWNNDLVKFKENLGLPLGRKTNIEIPPRILSNNELKKAVIRGIFDTDGGIYLENKNKKLYPRMHITTISFELSEQILNVFKENKIRTTRYSQLYNKKFNRKRAYIISVRGVEMFHKFIKEISPKNPKHIRKYERFLNSQNL